MILCNFLGIKLPEGNWFTYLISIFSISTFALVIYLPFFKKNTTNKSKETKILLSLWILVSLIALGIWSAITSVQISDFMGDIHNILSLLLVLAIALFVVGIPFLILNYIVGRGSPQKRQIVIFSICSALIASLITAGLMYSLKPNKTSIQVSTMDLKDRTSFSCSTKIGTTLFPKPDYEDNVFKTVDGALFTDDNTKMAIEIDGKELKMITATAVEAGMTEPARLDIVRDSDSELVAIDLQKDILIEPGAGTFILNKKTGTAVWTKSKPAFIGSSLPDAQAYFMECR